MNEQTKRLYIMMAVTFLLIVGYNGLMVYLQKQHPEWKLLGPTTQPAAAEAAATQPSMAGAVARAGSTTAPTVSATTQFAAAGEAKGATLGSAKANDPEYAMQLALSARGAGIESVTLNDYKKKIETDDRYVFQQPWEGNADATRAMATQWISVNGQRADLGSVNWALEKSSGDSATYLLDGPQVAVRKTYTVVKRASADTHGFEVKVEYSFANKTAAPVTVRTGFNGTVTPPREVDRGPDRNAVAGYFRADREKVVIEQHYIDDYNKDKPEADLTKSGEYPLMWIGLTSVYFDALVRPDRFDGTTPLPPEWVARAGVRAANPEALPPERVVTTELETGDFAVAPGETKTLPMRLYLGPKSRGVINSDYYSALPFGYDKTLVVSGGMCGFCVFDWVINGLVGLLRAIHFVVRDWGIAIIVLVLMVRAVLHPITKRSQVSMMKMGKMGPEMERIKQKYKDDQEAMNKATMEFYKEQGVGPFLGCLPMFLQMPIFIGLYSCLQTTFELRHSPFLQVFGHHLTWIHDLSQPDRLVWFPNHPVSLYFIHFDAINLLPILCAVVSFFNMKYTPRPPAATPEAEQQQKMMQWMTLIFPLMFYNLAAGLNLYYVTTMGFGIIEGKIIRKHIKEREEAEKAGKVFVEAKVRRHGGDDSRGGGGGFGAKRKPGGGKPSGGILGTFMENLQKKAAEIQRQAEKKK